MVLSTRTLKLRTILQNILSRVVSCFLINIHPSNVLPTMLSPSFKDFTNIVRLLFAVKTNEKQTKDNWINQFILRYFNNTLFGPTPFRKITVELA